MKHLALGALAAVAVAFSASAEPNSDIVGACRSSSSSYVAMQQCIDAERKARNLQSCLDALSSPCRMSEVRQ